MMASQSKGKPFRGNSRPGGGQQNGQPLKGNAKSGPQRPADGGKLRLKRPKKAKRV